MIILFSVRKNQLQYGYSKLVAIIYMQHISRQLQKTSFQLLITFLKTLKFSRQILCGVVHILFHILDPKLLRFLVS